ncbi:MAG: ammonium transporter [Verrucomicrobiae bacterium]|nr:ammonium transporter [Verrucomicrobiae bacterium]
MKSILLTFALVLGCVSFTETHAQNFFPEQRLKGVEAYLLNSDPTGSAVTGVAGPGHNAWMMISTALVLFMTLPGLALFYGGLVRSKNVLSVVAQCFASAGIITILWWAFGYSLIFGTSFSERAFGSFLGGSEFFFFKDVLGTPNTNYSYWVSQNIFSMFQLMFAIITPALIVGAIAERMKFIAIAIFMALWFFAVYVPMAHMVWGATGWMNGVWNAAAKITAIDFAGGTVVHMASGWSALVLCILLGKRKGYPTSYMPPHSLVLCAIGTGMLWVGWYGFNAGSALAADGIATNAFMTTTLAAAVAGLVWPLLEYFTRGQGSVLGFCSGVVAGLVTITPACGFVSANGAMLIGLVASFGPFLAVTKLKKKMGYDDTLDTFGIHAVGGTIGALLTGFLTSSQVNPNLLNESYAAQNGLKSFVENGGLWLEQVKAIGMTIGISVVGTLILGLLVKWSIGLRVSDESEIRGLDLAEHGEEGYLLNQ